MLETLRTQKRKKKSQFTYFFLNPYVSRRERNSKRTSLNCFWYFTSFNLHPKQALAVADLGNRMGEGFQSN